VPVVHVGRFNWPEIVGEEIVGDVPNTTVVPVPVVAVKRAGGTCVNAMIYPYAV
jgi:hypothetical protein